MAQADIASRLEAVTARLEKLAGKLEKGGSKTGGGDDEEVPQYVTDFEALVNKEVAAAIKASQDIGLPEVPALFKKAFDTILDLIRRVPKSKKPDDQTMAKFLQPGSEVMTTADTLKIKGPEVKKFGDHYKAFYELVSSISWVSMVPPQQLPFQYVEAQQGATDFNLNRILKATPDDKQKAWVRSLQALNKAHKEYVGNYFKKTGLEWNPQGGDLLSVQVSVSTSASTTSAAPKSAAPKNDDEKQNPKKEDSGPGMDAVMNQLSQGLNVTSGLKKVTSDMKTKNRSDRTGKVEVKEHGKKVCEKQGQPQTVQKGGRWVIENHNDGVHTLDKFDMKSNVFFTMNDDATFQVTTKIKAVCIDSCINCRVFIKEVISTVEIINCQHVTLVCEDKVPSIAVDKSQSPRIILMRKAYETHPDIYTSNIAAMNVEIPGKTDADDMIEIPIPEQFLTKIDPATGKAATVETKHG